MHSLLMVIELTMWNPATSVAGGPTDPVLVFFRFFLTKITNSQRGDPCLQARETRLPLKYDLLAPHGALSQTSRLGGSTWD